MTGRPQLLVATRETRFGPALPRKTVLAFAAAVVAVALIALLSYRALVNRGETSERVNSTLAVMQQLEALLSNLKDAETGQRGFLLTDSENYLLPYNSAKAALPGELKELRALWAGNPVQLRRLEAVEQLTSEKMAELAETIDQRRAGNPEAALAIVRTDRGRAAMNGIRTLIADMQTDERRQLAERQRDWQDAAQFSSVVTWAGSALLLLLIAGAALTSARDHRNRQIQAWVRSGQMGLADRIQGEQRLDVLGANVLDFLTAYLGAEVGAIYLAQDGGDFRRVAGHALAASAQAEVVRPGDGLLGQAAKAGRALRVQQVPEGYLDVSSSLGRARANELLLAPASIDGVVHAVIELAFLQPTHAADRELLERVSEALGVAVRSAKNRTRLEELLNETQTQAEELQAQQEELRVSNEELEEQANALKRSQAQLEVQQTELEQTNAQLEEQAQLLEHQKDDLARSQDVLMSKAAELERSNQYKSEFLANMSHELRTPLNSTLILAKLLADNRSGNLSDEQVKFAQTISSSGNDLLNLINDILDLSKIEAGKVELTVEPVTIARVVDNLARTLQPIARTKGVALHTEIDADTPATLETDAQRLAQILTNLLSNAIKFTERGEVSLRVGAGPGGVAFAVRDTGIGIPAEQQEMIFEAFRQADGSTHRKYGGTGLGLSISRDLARLLGGDISVQSTPGAGSVFTLALPLGFTPRAVQASSSEVAEAPAESSAMARSPAIEPAHAVAAPAPGAARPPAPPGVADDRDSLIPGSRLILVIEDDLPFAAILRDLAREKSFQCIVTHTANDGLAAARHYRPSAILLDMNLPDHSGLGVLDQLKHDPATRHIPVHVASVADYSHEAMELGAIGYALKPVKREQLVEALERLEAKFSQGLRTVLVVEDDARQRQSIEHLLGNAQVRIVAVENAADALAALRSTTFDCMVMDLNLPDLSGYELLEQMSQQEQTSFPPVIVYTGRSLTRDEEQQLRRYSKSIIIKDARSPERLLDEVTLFLHQVESTLPAESQRLLKVARHRESALDGRRVLVVEDDVRNIFALSSVLEPKGIKVEIARNGREALESLERSSGQPATAIDLVLMDIMMPEMDGFTAMREIRKRPEWKRLPIIALTAKAMRDDQEKCMAAGANDYIAKPLDVEKLLSLVRVWMPK